ncbi:hypothetical protein [Algoriphagus zhangzhouensis]|uniref:Uncharacterized protein n=1 Tax=Algoriphagus zhangzhouensis TaxID=1073327 RepID=A0A1M7ZA93_9BACT|nr:hypothetical protein [Algoriphagus zhangzhouensis]TDY47356.1 hypothetical protein A8938_1810 [Algoriphagus zhangzhouensis]SHO61606.1 hypothetical protein SAMN04488108_1452 [Algoriphagus zhangzhouensis]
MGKNIFNTLSSAIRTIIGHYKNINELIVKSDEENIDDLLKKPKDKLAFEEAIEDLMKEKSKSKKIILNNKEVTISI